MQQLAQEHQLELQKHQLEVQKHAHQEKIDAGNLQGTGSHELLTALHRAISAPRELVRDASGRAIGSRIAPVN
jgi:hypothetical protein